MWSFFSHRSYFYLGAPGSDKETKIWQNFGKEIGHSCRSIMQSKGKCWLGEIWRISYLLQKSQVWCTSRIYIFTVIKLKNCEFEFHLPKLITMTKIVLMSVDRKIIYQFRHIFRQLFQNQKFLIDYVFDWNKVSWLRHYDVIYSNTSLCSLQPEKILIVLILASKMAIDWQPIRINLCTNPF